MLNLIFKEYITQKRYLGSSITYCLLLFFVFGYVLRKRLGLDISPILAGTVYFVHFMMTVSCTIDEKQNTDAFLVCLPLDRWEIVAAKFLWLMGLGAGAFAALSIVSVGAAALPLDLGLPVPGVAEIMGTFAGLCVLTLAYLPVYFRNGVFGSRFAGVVVFGAAFGVASGVFAWIGGAAADRSELALSVLLGAGVLAAAMSGAVGLAARFYSRREL